MKVTWWQVHESVSQPPPWKAVDALDQQLVAKRMRSAADTTEEKEPQHFCDIAEELVESF